MKKTISMILAVLMLFCSVPVTLAAESPRLYDIYSDHMLFAQNKDAIIAGTASAGTKIEAKLINAAGKTVKTGKANADKNGKFTVSFKAPSGSYSAYKIALSANGEEFAALNDVLFGELWIASGQSNMMYTYNADENYETPGETVTDAKDHIRILLTPAYPEYNGSELKQSPLPLDDIKDSYWITANDPDCDACSAVAYYFALDLIGRINVPVGILNISLGGSSLISWLSRDAIESDPTVKQDIIDIGKYIPLDDWDEDNANIYQDMTCLYNKKISPIRYFRPSGMIWYQGENELIIGGRDGSYSDSFDLMQRSYSELFKTDGLLPIVFCELAPFFYFTPDALTKRNLEFVDMQQYRPESRALVSSYDYPPTYYKEQSSIHPMTKKPIGERMSFAASGLVYSQRTDYTMPTVKDVVYKNGGVTLTFANVGDGLVCTGNTLRGFAVCGEDGIFVRADAVIKSKNTVFVSCGDISQPKGVTYAYAMNSDKANLFASEGGSPTLPAARIANIGGFAGLPDGVVPYMNNSWTECEEPQIWHNTSKTESAAFFNSWTSNKSAIEFKESSAYSGTTGLNIVSGQRDFSVSSSAIYNDGSRTYLFEGQNTDWTHYGKLTVMIRNNTDKDAELTALKLYTSVAAFYTPTVDGTDGIKTVLPADGEWHKITFDLNSMYLDANSLVATVPAKALDTVREVRFVFGSKGEADIDLDDIRFIPNEDPSARVRFDRIIATIVKFIKAITNMFATLAKLFGSMTVIKENNP